MQLKIKAEKIKKLKRLGKDKCFQLAFESVNGQRENFDMFPSQGDKLNKPFRSNVIVVVVI